MVAQVALTVVLLAATGLLLRSLANTTRTDAGFDAERVLAFDVSLPKSSYDTDARKLAFVAAQDATTLAVTAPAALTLRPETVTPLTVADDEPLTVTTSVLAA